MTRRDLLRTLAVVPAVALLFRPALLLARQVDPRFLKMYEDAQRERPATLSSVARIAPSEEPGTPLVVRGQVFDRTGEHPLAGVVVFAYHTDRDGLYNRPGTSGWRLQGWVRTNDDGRFEFDTIRPAPYPRRNAAAHIHVYLDGPGVPRQTLPSMLFEDDALLSDAEKAHAVALGRFSNARPVVVDKSGREIYDIALRATGENVF